MGLLQGQEQPGDYNHGPLIKDHFLATDRRPTCLKDCSLLLAKCSVRSGIELPLGASFKFNLSEGGYILEVGFLGTLCFLLHGEERKQFHAVASTPQP